MNKLNPKTLLIAITGIIATVLAIAVCSPIHQDRRSGEDIELQSVPNTDHPVSFRGRIQRVLGNGVLARLSVPDYLANDDRTDQGNAGTTEDYCYITGDPRQRTFTDGRRLGLLVRRVGILHYGSQTIPWYEYVSNASRDR